MKIVLFFLKNMLSSKRINYIAASIIMLILVVMDVMLAELVAVCGLDEVSPIQSTYSFMVDIPADRVDQVKETVNMLSGINDACVVEQRKVDGIVNSIDIICYLLPISENRDYTHLADLVISDRKIGYRFTFSDENAGMKLIRESNIKLENYTVDPEMVIENSYASPSVNSIYCNSSDYTVLAEKIGQISFYFDHKLSDEELFYVESKIDDVCGKSLVIKPQSFTSYQYDSVKQYFPVYFLLVFIIIWCAMEVGFYFWEICSVEVDVYRLCGASQKTLFGLQIITIIVFELLALLPSTLIYYFILESEEIVRCSMNPGIIVMSNEVVLITFSVLFFLIRKMFSRKEMVGIRYAD